MVDAARLMSFGEYTFNSFALKRHYKWIKDERMIMSQRDLTRDIELNDLADTEVDGIDIRIM